MLNFLKNKSHKQFIRAIQLIFCTGVTGFIFSTQAGAADLDGANLTQERRCYACHDITDYLLGPPYTAIAVRHAERKDILVEVLAEKIIVGGAGNWGVVPMVPNEHVSMDEARAIAKWILNLESK